MCVVVVAAVVVVVVVRLPEFHRDLTSLDKDEIFTAHGI